MVWPLLVVCWMDVIVVGDKDDDDDDACLCLCAT